MMTARQVEDTVRREWPDGGTVRAQRRGSRWVLTIERMRKAGTRVGFWAETVVQAETPDALLKAFRSWLAENSPGIETTDEGC